MISVGKFFCFSASHFLPFHKGQCRNVHGHNYKLEVRLSSEKGVDHKEGMVLDFGDLDAIIEKNIIDLYDHKDLNDIVANPTAENLIKLMAEDIRELLPGLIHLEELNLWETEKCYARWTKD